MEPIATQPQGIAARVRMRFWSVMLRHAAPLPLPFDATFINGGALRWIARDSSKPGRPHRTAAAYIAATNLEEALVLTKPNGPMSEQGCE